MSSIRLCYVAVVLAALLCGVASSSTVSSIPPGDQLLIGQLDNGGGAVVAVAGGNFGDQNFVFTAQSTGYITQLAVQLVAPVSDSATVTLSIFYNPTSMNSYVGNSFTTVSDQTTYVVSIPPFLVTQGTQYTFKEHVDSGTVTFSTSPGSHTINIAGLASPSSSSSSSSGMGAAYSDPYFSGFWRQLFYVHGKVSEVYGLISDSSMQLNSRLVFLTNITCPELDVPGQVHCSDHPGTYFGEMGLVTRNGEHMRVEAGDVLSGFSRVVVNGVDIAVGESYGAPPLPSIAHESHASLKRNMSSSHAARDTIYVKRTSFRSLQVHIGIYELQIDNSDRYLDLVTVNVVSWTELMQRVQPEGLMGCTWNASAPMPPNESNYWERDSDLLGHNTQVNKFDGGGKLVSDGSVRA